MGGDYAGAVLAGDLDYRVVRVVVDDDDVIAGVEGFEGASQAEGVVVCVQECGERGHETTPRGARMSLRQLRRVGVLPPAAPVLTPPKSHGTSSTLPTLAKNARMGSPSRGGFKGYTSNIKVGQPLESYLDRLSIEPGVPLRLQKLDFDVPSKGRDHANRVQG